MGKKEIEEENKELGIEKNDYKCEVNYDGVTPAIVAGAIEGVLLGAAAKNPYLAVGPVVAEPVKAIYHAHAQKDICQKKARGELVREARRELKAEEDAKIEKLLDGARCEPPKPTKPEEKKEEQRAPAVEEDRFKKELHAIIDAPDEKFEPRKVFDDLERMAREDRTKRKAERDAKSYIPPILNLNKPMPKPQILPSDYEMPQHILHQYKAPEIPKFEYKAPEMPKFEYKAPEQYRQYEYKPYVPKLDFAFSPAPAPIKAPPMPKFEYQAPAQYKQYEYKPYVPKLDWMPKLK